MHSLWILDREELAWSAGFYDGEGCTRVINSGRWKYPNLNIGQIDEEVLYRFNAATGYYGAVSFQESINPKHRDQYRLNITTFEHCQAVISMLWSWLSLVKRDQAHKVFLEIREHNKKTVRHRRNKAVCGTPSKYTGGCRCQACTFVIGEYNRNYLARKGK